MFFKYVSEAVEILDLVTSHPIKQDNKVQQRELLYLISMKLASFDELDSNKEFHREENEKDNTYSTISNVIRSVVADVLKDLKEVSQGEETLNSTNKPNNLGSDIISIIKILSST
jgi:hypothetical protein